MPRRRDASGLPRRDYRLVRIVGVLSDLRAHGERTTEIAENRCPRCGLIRPELPETLFPQDNGAVEQPGVPRLPGTEDQFGRLGVQSPRVRLCLGPYFLRQHVAERWRYEPWIQVPGDGQPDPHLLGIPRVCACWLRLPAVQVKGGQEHDRHDVRRVARIDQPGKLPRLIKRVRLEHRPWAVLQGLLDSAGQRRNEIMASQPRSSTAGFASLRHGASLSNSSLPRWILAPPTPAKLLTRPEHIPGLDPPQ